MVDLSIVLCEIARGYLLLASFYVDDVGDVVHWARYDSLIDLEELFETT